MKKTYILLTTLVLSLMFAGLSFAYWTDTLTVSGMADTGELSVVFCCDNPFPTELNNEMYGVYNSTDSYITDDMTTVEIVVTEEGRFLVVTFNNLYPGASGKVTACIKNDGTIPAKLTNMQLVDVFVEDYDPAIDDLPNGIMKNLILRSQIFDFPVTSWIPGDMGVLNLEYNNQFFYPDGLLELSMLQPTENHIYTLDVYLHEDAENSTQERTVTFKILLDYEQFNTPS